jgi:hypothetical protein
MFMTLPNAIDSHSTHDRTSGIGRTSPSSLPFAPSLPNASLCLVKWKLILPACHRTREETTDRDFVCKTMNKTGCCSQWLLPVPKYGFEPLRPPNLCTMESRNATALKRFRSSFRCLSLGPLPATVDAIGKNSIPAPLVTMHRSSSSLLALSHASLLGSRIVAPQVRECPLSW